MNELITVSFRNYIAYKSKVVVNLVTNPVTVLVMLFVWVSVYGNSGSQAINGFTLSDMINYYVVLMFGSLIAGTWVDRSIGEDINNGDLMNKLLRPIKTYLQYLYNELGVLLGTGVFEVLPFMIVCLLVGLLKLDFFYGIIGIASFILAYFLNFFFSINYGLMFFKFRNYKHLVRIKVVIMEFLSGVYIPLAMFPNSVKGLVGVLPFNYMLYSPASIMIGHESLESSLLIIGIQAVYILAFFVLFKVLWPRALETFRGVGQ